MHFILLYLTFDVDCIQTTTTCILTTQNVIVNPRFVESPKLQDVAGLSASLLLVNAYI